MPARRTTRTSRFLAVGALLAAPLALAGPVHAADPQPVRVVPPEGVTTGGEPSGLDLSADGRWVVYTGRAGATYGIYATDRTSGTTATVLTGSTPVGTLSVSGDGSRIAYVAGTLGASYDGDAQVRVVERATGVSSPVSVTAAGVAGNGISSEPVISQDGSVVAFTTRATNLVAGTEGTGSDVVVRVLGTGALERISGVGAELGAYQPSVSADGDRVAFATDQQLVDGDTPSTGDVVVRTRSTGTYTLVTSTVENSASAPAITADGRQVAYLVAEGGRPEVTLRGIFLTRLADGVTERVGVYNGSDMSSPGPGPRVSADGRFVAFTALGVGAGQRTVEGYLRDRGTGTTRWVSEGTRGAFGAAGALSATGRYVVTTGVGGGDLDIWVTDFGAPEPAPDPDPDPEPEPDPEPPVVVTPPYLAPVRADSGPSYALRVENGVWAGGPAGLTTSYQWLRDGQPIAGETSKTYVVKTSDFGKKIVVRETVALAGKVWGTVDSNPVTAQKATSELSAKVAGTAGRNAVVLEVRVGHDPDVRPQGKVLVVWAGGLRLVDVGADGTARVTVRTLWPGRHAVGLVHVPTAYVKAAAAQRIEVQVRR